MRDREPNIAAPTLPHPMTGAGSNTNPNNGTCCCGTPRQAVAAAGRRRRYTRRDHEKTPAKPRPGPAGHTRPPGGQDPGGPQKWTAQQPRGGAALPAGQQLTRTAPRTCLPDGCAGHHRDSCHPPAGDGAPPPRHEQPGHRRRLARLPGREGEQQPGSRGWRDRTGTVPTRGQGQPWGRRDAQTPTSAGLSLSVGPRQTHTGLACDQASTLQGPRCPPGTWHPVCLGRTARWAEAKRGACVRVAGNSR